jgi:hypothetical protein
MDFTPRTQLMTIITFLGRGCAMIETVAASVLFCWGTGDLLSDLTVCLNSTCPFGVRTMFIIYRQGGSLLLWRPVRFFFLTSLTSSLDFGRRC